MIKLEDIEQRSDQDRRAAEPEHPCDPLIAQRRGQRIVGGGFVLQTRPQMFRYAGKPHLLHLTRRSAQVRDGPRRSATGCLARRESGPHIRIEQVGCLRMCPEMVTLAETSS